MSGYAVSQVLSQFTKPDRSTLMKLLSLLWQRPQRELQYFAIDVAKSNANVLCGTSDTQCLEAAQFVGAELIASKSWWDTVDAVASNGESFIVQEKMVLRSI